MSNYYVYCKRSNTGGGNSPGTRLANVIRLHVIESQLDFNFKYQHISTTAPTYHPTLVCGVWQQLPIHHPPQHLHSIPPPLTYPPVIPWFLESWRGSGDGHHPPERLPLNLSHPLHWHTVNIELVSQQSLCLLPVKSIISNHSMTTTISYIHTD